MYKVCSICSQMLKLFSRGDFEKAVKEHKAERHARGFTSWGQFAPRPPKTTEHQRKETCPGNLDVAIFRLTPHWNRTAVSGSRRIGINSRFQAHLWIGKCSA